MTFLEEKNTGNFMPKKINDSTVHVYGNPIFLTLAFFVGLSIKD